MEKDNHSIDAVRFKDRLSIFVTCWYEVVSQRGILIRSSPIMYVI